MYERGYVLPEDVGAPTVEDITYEDNYEGDPTHEALQIERYKHGSFALYKSAISELNTFCGISKDKLVNSCANDMALISIILKNVDAVITFLEELIPSEGSLDKKYPTFEEMVALGQNNPGLLHIILKNYKEVIIFLLASPDKSLSFKELVEIGHHGKDLLSYLLEYYDEICYFIDLFDYDEALNEYLKPSISLKELIKLGQENLDVLKLIISERDTAISLIHSALPISFFELSELGKVNIEALRCILENYNEVLQLIVNPHLASPISFAELVEFGKINPQVLRDILYYYNDIFSLMQQNEPFHSFADIAKFSYTSTKTFQCIIENYDEILELMCKLNISLSELENIADINYANSGLLDQVLIYQDNVLTLANSNKPIFFQDIVELWNNNWEAALYLIKNPHDIIVLINKPQLYPSISFEEILKFSKETPQAAAILDIMNTDLSLSLVEVMGLHHIIKKYGHEAAYLIKDNPSASLDKLIKLGNATPYVLENILQNFGAISRVMSHPDYNDLDKVMSLYTAYKDWFIKNGNIYYEGDQNNKNGLDKLPHPASIGHDNKGRYFLKNGHFNTRTSYRQNLIDKFHGHYIREEKYSYTIIFDDKVHYNDGSEGPLLDNYSSKFRRFEVMYDNGKTPSR